MPCLNSYHESLIFAVVFNSKRKIYYTYIALKFCSIIISTLIYIMYYYIYIKFNLYFVLFYYMLVI